MGSFIALLRARATWPTLLLMAACSTGKAERAQAEPFRVELTSVRKDHTRTTHYERVLVWIVWPDSCFRVRTEKSLAKALEHRGVRAGLASAHITLRMTLDDLVALYPVVRASTHDYEALLTLMIFGVGAVDSPLVYMASLWDPSDLDDGKEVWQASGLVEGPDAVAREVPRIVEAMVKDGLIR